MQRSMQRLMLPQPLQASLQRLSGAASDSTPHHSLLILRAARCQAISRYSSWPRLLAQAVQYFLVHLAQDPMAGPGFTAGPAPQ